MHSDQAFEAIVARITTALQAAESQQPGDAHKRLAERFAQTWQQYAARPSADTAHQCGADFAHANFNVTTLVKGGAILQSTLDSTAANTLWQFMSDTVAGYVDVTRRSAQDAAISEIRATQQREDQLRAVIQELSTPIIPIYRGVLVLPLVGTIDSMRSQDITERLLEEIVRQQADIVIIDITGVSVVDTSVANHLIMTAQAVNLLGSRVIFTGISSTIAQTIVQLGVNLGDVVTLSNLQAGMLYALEQLGLGIAELTA